MASVGAIYRVQHVDHTIHNMSSLWRNRDIILRCYTKNLRISGIIASNTIAEACKRWKIPVDSPQCKLWSEYMAGTVMLSAFHKGEERIKLQLRSQAIKELYVEALAVGEVRGRMEIQKSFSDSQHSHSNSSAEGSLQIDKILYGEAKPYTTHIPATGVAYRDFEYYYRNSDQIPTRVRIHTSAEKERIHCCGITLQEMPVSDEYGSEYKVEAFDISNAHFSDIANAQEFVERVSMLTNVSLKDVKIDRIPLDFYCRCSKQSFKKRIMQLPKESIAVIRKDLKIAKRLMLTCQFCNEVYEFLECDLEDEADSE